MKAFPNERLFQQGMDLRDYFAAKALQGLLASSDVNQERFGATGFVDNLVKSAYIYADAMMKEREL